MARTRKNAPTPITTPDATTDHATGQTVADSADAEAAAIEAHMEKLEANGHPAANVDREVEFNPAELDRPTTLMTVNEPHKPVPPTIGTRLPDPHSIDQISLTDDPSGPQMRLLRSHRHGDVWIEFDVNPGKEITDQIKAEGFRWERRAEYHDHQGAWVKPLEPGYEVRTMLDAERIFKELGNTIRESKGLEPVGQSQGVA